MVGCSVLAARCAPGGPAMAAPPGEAESLAFTQQHHALRHGGIVGAAHSPISCRTTPLPARLAAPLRLASQRDTARGGALFAAADAKQ
ncbi:hypothetical protein GCM10011579_013870 [Streptomyces albiflavescens]|uniref:Uncharacterized protein n=2 Tax=Streptomyces albiflavescens TaxID=1623582 RepID=A0A917XUM8_9ACTN|nr:hypothetical protein GCM10011579_013870 [Streptomyces albiflavescens]